MKRRDLIRHVVTHGCELLREGGNHSVYINRVAQTVSTIPRHREINDFFWHVKSAVICRCQNHKRARRQDYPTTNNPRRTLAECGVA